MEQKYICVLDGELVFDSAAHGTLNEHNIAEANAELAEKAVGCRREAEHNIYSDIRINKIISLVAIAFGSASAIASVIMTIVMDWGFFILIVLCGIMLLFGLLILLLSIKKQKRYANILDSGDLYFAQVVKAPVQLFGAKLRCACVIDGQPRVLIGDISSAAFTALQKKQYIIIAYDKATTKFLPIRLFSDDSGDV